MAKITHCEFCGKELTKGFFRGDDYYLDLGLDYDVCCCEDCYDRYEEDAERIKERFSIKLDNYKTSTRTRKVDGKFIKDFFLLYLDQERESMARCGDRVDSDAYRYMSFIFDGHGHFAVREFPLIESDITDDMMETLNVIYDVCPVWFSKDDITRLEYRVVSFGEALGVFSSAYSFEIRFNDEKTLTFKPCIARLCCTGKSLLFSEKKNAKANCVTVLQTLKDTLGLDLPIVEVKKFL